MEHPYIIPEPRQLTERLRQQWLRIRAQNRHLHRVSHSPDPAHVEPNVPSTRNSMHWMQYKGIQDTQKCEYVSHAWVQESDALSVHWMQCTGVQDAQKWECFTYA
jgi:hypothetical protein